MVYTPLIESGTVNRNTSNSSCTVNSSGVDELSWGTAWRETTLNVPSNGRSGAMDSGGGNNSKAVEAF